MLPKVDVPIYDLKLLSVDKKIRFRPFTVKEARKKVSRAGRPYLLVKISDEYGQMTCRLTDGGRDDKFTQYYEGGGKTPKEDDIVVLYGSKADDSIFLNGLTILTEKIYTKLSQIET